MQNFSFAKTALALASILLSTDAMSDQSVFSIAKSQAAINGVPLAAALSDLVTKSSANNIESGLMDGGVAPSNSSKEIAAFKTLAAQKGFVVRDVELSSVFQSNITRIQNQIKLEQLNVPSGRSGINVSVPNSQQIFGGANSLVRDPMVSVSEIFSHGNKGNAQIRTDLGIPSLPQTASATDDAQQGRIFGGVPIVSGNDAFADSVALVGASKICSGVLISATEILTAAHCYCEGVTEEADFGTSILPPVQKVLIDKEHSEVFRACSDVEKDLSLGDLALLRLKAPAPVAPKPIGNINKIKDAASVRAVGFGRSSQSIGFKYQVNIIIASYQCGGTVLGGIPDAQSYRCRPSYEMVAAGLNRDTCAGDSGGPIYVFGDDAKPYVVGITSRAVTSGQCGPGGIYVLLDAPPIREWLSQRGISSR